MTSFKTVKNLVIAFSFERFFEPTSPHSHHITGHTSFVVSRRPRSHCSKERECDFHLSSLCTQEDCSHEMVFVCVWKQRARRRSGTSRRDLHLSYFYWPQPDDPGPGATTIPNAIKRMKYNRVLKRTQMWVLWDDEQIFRSGGGWFGGDRMVGVFRDYGFAWEEVESMKENWNLCDCKSAFSNRVGVIKTNVSRNNVDL